MLYIIRYENNKVDILDTDDMVIETITRPEFNALLRKGIQIENIDKDIVLEHPRAEIKFTRLWDSGTEYMPATKNQKAHILIPGTYNIVRNLVVYNEKYNFHVHLLITDGMPRIKIWYDGIYFDTQVKQKVPISYSQGRRALFIINDINICELGLLRPHNYNLKCFGFKPEYECFYFEFSSNWIKTGKETVTCHYGIPKVRRGTGIEMSEKEFKRRLIFS